MRKPPSEPMTMTEEFERSERRFVWGMIGVAVVLIVFCATAFAAGN
jgi:hypothetical protein